MTRGPANTTLRVLEALFEAGSVTGLTDAQLLERFLDGRRSVESAELAFSALVERHGPMVLGVCRRVLRDASDAEDAFQSTFLVLIRKARTIQVTSNLGPWLFTVALRTAQEARTRAARRRAREAQVVAMRHAETGPDEGALELRGLLDSELGRLPERYRAPLVLCELEGRSRREAAAVLGVPEGTVSSRLSRGRALLRDRLARRGLDVSAGALAIALSRETTAAPIPPALGASTVRAAMQIAAGHAATGVISASVASLTEGVLKAMLMTKLKGILLVVVAGGVVVTGAGVLAQAPQPAPTPALAPAPTANPSAGSEPGNDRLDALEQKIDRLIRAIESSERPTPPYHTTSGVHPMAAPPAGLGPPGAPSAPVTAGGGASASAGPGGGFGGYGPMGPGRMPGMPGMSRMSGMMAGAASTPPPAGASEPEWRQDVERRIRRLERRLDEVVSRLEKTDGTPRGAYAPATTPGPAANEPATPK